MITTLRFINTSILSYKHHFYKGLLTIKGKERKIDGLCWIKKLIYVFENIIKNKKAIDKLGEILTANVTDVGSLF